MIIGMGSDLCNIERIAAALARHGDRFEQRCFTPVERAKAASRPHTRAGTLAKRFAAKEAFSKAVGTGFYRGVYMKDIGVEVTVDAPDWATVTSSYEDGTFDSGIVWANNAPTPYQFFRGVMSTETVKAVGEKTFENYHRFGLPEADTLLAQFAATSDTTAQHAIVDRLQELYADNAPVIPLFPGPEWGAYTDVRFTGWPTEDDPYATLNVRAPTTVLVLTTLEPVVD